MAIKRLVREAQFPNIGKLRKGGVKPETGKAPGKDLTYFRFDTDDERASKMFHAVYGNEPSEINVYLPHQTTEQNFTCWQEAYVAGGLQHRCDGETCVIWLSPDGKKYHTEPKPCPGGCKEVGRLMVIIPELQRFAFITAETHSIHDIMRLTKNLQAVEYLRGDLRGIPFILKRTPVEISTPAGDGKRARREKWLLSIEVDPAWAALQLESMHRAALTVNGVTVDDSRLLTTAYVDEDEGEIVTMETQSGIPAQRPPSKSRHISYNGDAALSMGAEDDGIQDDDEIPARVAEWLEQAKPADAAKEWAVEIGAQPNEQAARASLKKIVDSQFGGKLSRVNLPTALTAFYFRQQEKLNEIDTLEEVTIEQVEEVPFN